MRKWRKTLDFSTANIFAVKVTQPQASWHGIKHWALGTFLCWPPRLLQPATSLGITSRPYYIHTQRSILQLFCFVFVFCFFDSVLWHLMFRYPNTTWFGRQGYRSRFSDPLRAGLSGVRTPLGARHSALVQRGRGANASTCTMDIGSLSGG